MDIKEKRKMFNQLSPQSYKDITALELSMYSGNENLLEDYYKENNATLLQISQ